MTGTALHEDSQIPTKNPWDDLSQGFFCRIGGTQPPRYAFFTFSLLASSTPVPLSVILPVSST